MNIVRRLRNAALSAVLALFVLGPALPVLAQSMPGAVAPARPKAAIVESLKLPSEALATSIRLEAPGAAAIESLKRANAGPNLKRLQIGVNRDVSTMPNANASALAWTATDGGFAARWSITSEGARALRVGLALERTAPSLQIRFSGESRPDTVYGPFTEADTNASAGALYWSPVLEGETAIVELFVAGAAAPRDLAISVGQVSHLLVNPAEPQAEATLKAIGDSQFCEVNLICRSASDAALASAGRAVARMTFSTSGGSFLCTGTLLNSGGGQFIPYFYSAAHCISDQSTASTLTTWWFYESTSCGSNSLNPSNQQIAGGATLLYANVAFDIVFLRLNRAPPDNATFAGWDSATLAGGTPLTAIHHPAGDLKKVSLGTFGGYVSNPPDLGHPSGSFIKSNWLSLATGVTEGGSSGSGIFTQAGGQYAFRGGLLGGPSSCFASSADLNDYYSRFDVAYQNISQYLQATTATNYTALWWNAPDNSESGWGVNIAHQGDIVFATLFTYDASGNPLWLVMSNGARQGTADTFSGTLFRTNGQPFNQTQTNVGVTQVGTMTISFSGPNNGTLSYSVNGVAVSKSITKQVFASPGAAQCVPTTASRASATNFTDLWFASPAFSESGWGINITQQGNTMFATLFTYDQAGQPLWLVMSAGQRTGGNNFNGALYQTRGNGAFNAQPWPGVTVSQVGNMQLTFSNGENGTLTYSVNGVTVTKPITRQVFSTPFAVCS